MKKSLQPGPLAYLWLLPILLFLPLMGDGAIFAYRDLVRAYLPYYFSAAEIIRAGELPLWQPLIFGGTPYFAALQGQVFYPPQWLVTLMPSWIGIGLYQILHFSLALFGFLKLARTLGLSLAAGALAGLCFVFGAPLLSTMDTVTAFAALAWLPLVVNQLLLAFRTRSQGSVALAALFTALQFLAGEPQILCFSFLILPFFIWGWPGEKSTSRSVLPAAFGFVLLFGALTAFQALPFWRELRLSTRVAWSAQDLTWNSLHPLELGGLLSPTFFGNLNSKWFGQEWLRGLYLGLVPISLLAFLPKSSRPARALLALAILFYGLAIADFIPGLSTVLASLPILGSARYPAKYYLVALFALALLAGMGLDRFEQLQQRRKRLVFILPANIGVLGLLQIILAFGAERLVPWMLHHFPDDTFPRVAKRYVLQENHLAREGALVVMLGVLCGLGLWLKPLKKHSSLMVMALVGLECLVYFPQFTIRMPEALLRGQEKEFAGLGDEGGVARIYWRRPSAADSVKLYEPMDYRETVRRGLQSRWSMSGLLHGVGYINGYQGLIPQSVKEWERAVTEDFSVDLFREAGVTHLVSFRPLAASPLQLVAVEQRNAWLYEVQPRPEKCESPTGCKWEQQGTNAFVVHRADLKSAETLFVRERFHPNWQAEVQGRKKPIRPAGRFALSMAVDVEPGEDAIQFRYREPTLGWLLGLAILGLLTTAFCWTKDRRMGQIPTDA